MKTFVIDLETIGTTKEVVCGTILGLETNKYNKVFWKPKKDEIWRYILSIEPKENIVIYAHNHHYDFSRYGKITKNLKIINTSPFIFEYVDKNRKIKFLDTYNLSYTSLEKIGEIVKLPKLKTPISLIEGNIDQIEQDKNKIIKYNIRDCEILIKFIKEIKKMLKSLGIEVRNLTTISSIALKVLNQLLKNNKELKSLNTKVVEGNKTRITNPLFYNVEKTEWVRPKSYNQIKLQISQRAGRVECWKPGKYEKIYYYDVNSLFPYSLTQIEIPNLKTERLVKEPLNIYSLNELLDKIGVSLAIIKNENNKIGLLQARLENGTITYNTLGKYIVGYYSNLELKKAIQEGYKIVHIFESIIYKKLYFNPFKEITYKLYELKKNSKGFKRWFYKAIMNMSYGKLAQRNMKEEGIVLPIKEASKIEEGKVEVLNKNYIVNFKENKQMRFKRHYSPILPIYIRAYSRIFMYNTFKKIGLDNLVYTDTDSIFTTKEIDNLIKIGDELGEWKKEIKKDIEIIGKKIRIEGNIIKASGIQRQEVKENIIEVRRLDRNPLSNKYGEIETIKVNLDELKKEEKQFIPKIIIDKETQKFITLKEITYKLQEKGEIKKIIKLIK